MTTTAMVILGFAGLYLILGSALNWDILLNRSRNQWMVESLGRTGARILFALIGLVILAASIFSWLQARG